MPGMPRRPRHGPAGFVYHVLNRSAGRIALFRREQDFAAMERVLLAAKTRVDLPLLAWCFMKNHWHFVVQPKTDTQVTDFFRWLAHTHAMRWRVARATVGWGHLYQGRFKSFPVQDEVYFLRLCRYVEANAVRARLARCAEEWQWGGLYARQMGGKDFALAAWPVDRPRRWSALVNQSVAADELEELRTSVNRGRPLGDEGWVRATARRLGLEFTLHGVGRPRKEARKGSEK